MISPSGDTTLIIQNDGSVVLYRNIANSTPQTLWSVGSFGPGEYLALQNDGDIVVYDSNNNSRWDSGTQNVGFPPYTLTIYDYYIELTDKDGTKIWNDVSGILFGNFLTKSSITSPATLYEGQGLISPSGDTTLFVQDDGSVVLYRNIANSTPQTLWSVGSFGPGEYLALQNDGDIVVYDSNNNSRWDSGTQNVGFPPYTLTIYDYYIELTDKDGTKIWNDVSGILFGNFLTKSSITSPATLYEGQGLISPSGDTTLFVQDDGSVVLYRNIANSTPQTLWSVGSFGPGEYLALQNDGDIVVYDSNNNSRWDSGTQNVGFPPYTLTIYDYYIELTDKDGTKIWNDVSGILFGNFLTKSSITSPATLYEGQGLISPSGDTTLFVQDDGSVVLYRNIANSTPQTLWSVGSFGPGEYLALQNDGDIVVYDSNNNSRWDSGTQNVGFPPYTLTIYDYYIELTDKDGTKIWNDVSGILFGNFLTKSSITSPATLYEGQGLISPSGDTTLFVQDDGSVVLYRNIANSTPQTLWSVGSFGPGEYLALQNDGDIVVYDSNNNSRWDSGTQNVGFPPYTLTIYDYYIELTDKDGTKIWNDVSGILFGNFLTKSSITSPATLYEGQGLISPSGDTTLFVQDDGSVVLYRNIANSTPQTLWGIGSFGPGEYLALQNNGDIVIYDSNNNSRWDSGTQNIGFPPYTLTIYDYYIELTDKDGTKIWNDVSGILFGNFLTKSSITSPATLYEGQGLISPSSDTTLFVQDDGSVVLYRNIANSTPQTLWGIGSFGPGEYLALQNNGDIVIYDSNNNSRWDSGTQNVGFPPYTLTIYDYYIELTDKDGTKIWQEP